MARKALANWLLQIPVGFLVSGRGVQAGEVFPPTLGTNGNIAPEAPLDLTEASPIGFIQGYLSRPAAVKVDEHCRFHPNGVAPRQRAARPASVADGKSVAASNPRFTCPTGLAAGQCAVRTFVCDADNPPAAFESRCHNEWSRPS
jgi:hypothetical protein